MGPGFALPHFSKASVEGTFLWASCGHGTTWPLAGATASAVIYSVHAANGLGEGRLDQLLEAEITTMGMREATKCDELLFERAV